MKGEKSLHNEIFLNFFVSLENIKYQRGYKVVMESYFLFVSYSNPLRICTDSSINFVTFVYKSVYIFKYICMYVCVYLKENSHHFAKKAMG